MENYIVRIYRRDDKTNNIAGIVEVVDTQEKTPFRTHEELLILLSLIDKPGSQITREKR
jgi:hypothetical protein